MRQALVPLDSSLCHKLIAIHHDPVMAGHFGLARTLHRIRQTFWWPNMHKHTKAYIKACHRCQVHKRNKPPANHHPLRPSFPSGPNSRIHWDLIGPLPITAQDNVYGLVMVDSFTKWASVIPLRSKEGGEVANAIINSWYAIR